MVQCRYDVLNILTLVDMKCSNTVKPYSKCQYYRIKWFIYSFYIDLLVTTGGIKPSLRNINYQSMVVFLNMLF